MIPLLYKDAPNGTLPLISDTGYMNSHLFIDWLKHFVKHSKPSTEDHVLLIADNHTSHCSLPAVLFCREIHITFLTFPPHLYTHLKLKNGSIKWLVQNPGKAITLYKVSGIFQKAYSATSRVQLAEKAFRVTGIEPNNPEIISEDCYSPSLVTLAPLDKDCTVAVAVAPEENEVSPPTSPIDISIQSTLPIPRHEQRGAKWKGKSRKSEIMTSSPFKNLLEKNEKEKVELEEAKTNRVFKKNKNGDKTKKGKSLKAKKKTYSEFLSKTQFLHQVRQIMRGEYAQSADTHMMKIGSTVDYVRSGGMRNATVKKAVEHFQDESNTESTASSSASEEPSVPGTREELVSPVNFSEGESVLSDLNDPGTWPNNLTNTQRCFIVSKLMNKLVNESDLSNTYRDGRKLSKD
ncbi:hypothetical protein AVEN_86720-1 [Araneus ventricosus]|uniref:DDE-1 domain-containing protein n=1 Tax=Araneus ventricosus TaxID=182803 RepID=A0A4Y2HIJ0_ARAVE|nr:hypothetical protein AVEN_86720-1 [Araneus ventricosus]